MIHRDIKPENVLLEGDHAVVSDFGIARAVSEAGGDKLTRTGMSLGTPVYMSPEQASAEVVDARGDLYSGGHRAGTGEGAGGPLRLGARMARGAGRARGARRTARAGVG